LLLGEKTRPIRSAVTRSWLRASATAGPVDEYAVYMMYQSFSPGRYVTRASSQPHDSYRHPGSPYLRIGSGWMFQFRTPSRLRAT
jgi:hypothetical protein